MIFVCTYVRDGDLHKNCFLDYEHMLEWIWILKEQKVKKIRKYLVTETDEWYELK